MFLISTMSLTASIFLISNHPLFLVILLIFQTLLITATIYMLSGSSWMMMILFLIFLGGLLVIFSYLSALVPNESEKLQFIWMSIFFSPLLTYLFVPENTLMTSQILIKKMNTLSEQSFFIFLLMYLLMALLVTMLMAQDLKSPLHQENY